VLRLLSFRTLTICYYHVKSTFSPFAYQYFFWSLNCFCLLLLLETYILVLFAAYIFLFMDSCVCIVSFAVVCTMNAIVFYCSWSSKTRLRAFYFYYPCLLNTLAIFKAFFLSVGKGERPTNTTNLEKEERERTDGKTREN